MAEHHVSQEGPHRPAREVAPAAYKKNYDELLAAAADLP